MCVGKFTSDNNQLMISCSNACLYIIENLQTVEFFCATQNIVTELKSMRVLDLSYDIIACSGHWNGVKIFYNGTVRFTFLILLLYLMLF